MAESGGFLVTGEFGTVGELIAYLSKMDPNSKFCVYDGPFDQSFNLRIYPTDFNGPTCWIDVCPEEWFGEYNEDIERVVYSKYGEGDTVRNIPPDRMEKLDD